MFYRSKCFYKILVINWLVWIKILFSLGFVMWWRLVDRRRFKLQINFRPNLISFGYPRKRKISMGNIWRFLISIQKLLYSSLMYLLNFKSLLDPSSPTLITSSICNFMLLKVLLKYQKKRYKIFNIKSWSQIHNLHCWEM